MKALWLRMKASWLKSWPPRVGWGKWKWNAYLILEKYFYMGKGFSGERCGPWASCYEKYWPKWLRWAMCPLGLLLAHLSWKLKWAILIARCPSVRLSVNFYIFDFFSRTTGPILTRLGTNHHWGEDSNCSNEGDCLSPRGDNSKRVKIHWKFLKIFFSRTSGPISIKLGINHP
jgi:hypothetical protein